MANDTSISEHIKTLLSYLNQNLYGKEEAVRLALLSAVANESIFFMGPPGTAKSMISRRIAAAFKDFYKADSDNSEQEKKSCGNLKFSTENDGYFEYLMNEFSTPDEICGPVNLSALNEQPSKYERQTTGYLPSAKVAFLDEIWKSGPAILNTLLTIINEKKFHNGKNVEKVPLVSLASASNELPEKGRGLEALWDRFILRVFVNPVESEDDFFKLVDDGNKELILTDEYKSALLEISDIKKWQAEIEKIKLSDEAKVVINAIRKELTLLNADERHKVKDGENYYVSDRRWKKIVHILKTSAFLNGRKSVDLMDCSLIEYAIWNTDKQHEEVAGTNDKTGIIEKILQQNGIGQSTAIDNISDKVDDFKNAVNENWFEYIAETPAKPAADKIVTINGKECFECIKADDNTVWYVEVSHWATYGTGEKMHVIYDSNKNEIDSEVSLSRNGDTIKTYSMVLKVQKTKAIPAVPGHYDENSPLLFEPVAKKSLMESFDKEEYIPLVELIKSKIAGLKSFRAENEKPFSKNLFANTKRYSPILLNKIDKAIKTLEDYTIEVQKQHERYATDNNVKSDFKIGDIILLYFGLGRYLDNRYDYKGFSDYLIVCITGDNKNPAYAMTKIQSAPDFKGKTFAEAKELAESFYKDLLDSPYDSGWMLPTIEQLKQIYENCHANKAFKEFNLSGKFWSSSVKDDKSAYFIDFENGETDHTILDHQFNVLFIRKLAL